MFWYFAFVKMTLYNRAAQFSDKFTSLNKHIGFALLLTVNQFVKVSSNNRAAKFSGGSLTL